MMLFNLLYIKRQPSHEMQTTLAVTAVMYWQISAFGEDVTSSFGTENHM